MSSFVEFISDNGILATSAGITIGFATATFIKSFVADVVIPTIILLVFKLSKSSGKFVSGFVANKELHFTNFVGELITWALIVVSAFLIINAIRKHLLKTPSKPVVAGSNPFVPPQQKERFTMDDMLQEEQQEPLVVEPMADNDKQFAMY